MLPKTDSLSPSFLLHLLVSILYGALSLSLRVFVYSLIYINMHSGLLICYGLYSVTIIIVSDLAGGAPLRWFLYSLMYPWHFLSSA